MNATTGPYRTSRYTPTTRNFSTYTNGGVAVGPNNFNILNLRLADNFN